MDYDDNDFQSQNFQLVGEDTSKFSSGLKSFSLPGFDLDDHLQVHLRYDSLVETGELLGITGQEDSNWIENFSSGNSAIEFNSNAVKSHSTSRNDYVWTGSTSSESVEMLLKSVGEDYTMEKNAITKQPDSDHLLNSLCDSTDTCVSNVDPVNPKLETVMYADSALPPEKSHDSLPEIPEEVMDAMSPGSIGCQNSLNKKHLSECSADNAGGLLGDYSISEKLTSSSSLPFEDNKLQGKLALHQICEQRSQEESFVISPSNDHLVGDISKIIVDSTQLDSDHVVVDLPLTNKKTEILNNANKTDILNSQHACNQKPTEFIMDDQVEIESKYSKTDYHLAEVPKEESFGVLNDVRNFKVDHDEVGKDCADKGSSLLEEVGFTVDILNTCKVDFAKDQADLVCVHDQGKLDSSSTIMNATQETNKNQIVGIVDDIPVSLGNDCTNNSDAKQSFEMKKPEKQGVEESTSIVLDNSFESHITSSKTVCEVYVNKTFDEDLPELSGDAITSSELIKDKVSTNSCLPASHTIVSDGDVKKSLTTGKCLNILDRCSNLKTGKLVDSVTDTEHIVLETSGQPSYTISQEVSSQSSSPDNGFQICSDNTNAAAGLGLDEKGHIIVENNQNCQSEKLPFEDSKELTTTIAGDVHHSMGNSLQCINSSENICGSPTIITSDQHVDVDLSGQGNDKGGNSLQCINSSENICGSPTIISSDQHIGVEVVVDGQESDKGASNLTQSLCTSNTEKISRVTESIGKDPKDSNSSVDDKSFSFEVTHFSEHCEETSAKGWKLFSSPHASDTLQGTTLNSGKDPQSNAIGKTSQGSHLIFEGVNLQDAVIKSAVRSKDRSKPATGSASRRKTKEKSVSNKADSSGMRLSCSITEVSKLPDLNSASTTAVFNQPFTDSQQVQLRAQIFVYGSLIQGIPPDEACMVPAFGGVDGERGKWEGILRTLAEKYDCQKSPLPAETPSSSAAKSLDQISRSSALTSKVTCTPIQTANKTPTTIFNPISPPPPPMWNTSTCDKLHSNTSRGSNLDSNPILSPLLPYQSPNPRHYTSNVTPWSTQSPFPGPWVAPHHMSSVDTGIQHSVPPVTESIRYMSNKDLSLPHSTIQFIPSSAFFTTGSTSSSPVPLSPMQVDPSKGVSAPNKSLSSADQKSRRKKKNEAPETPVQTSSLYTHHKEVDLTIGAPNLIFTSPSANPSSTATSCTYASTISPGISPTHFQVLSSSAAEPKIILSEETCSKIGQAKLQAEDAAAFAASAVQHCQGIWNQLSIQQNSGIDSDIAQKLAFAAVAAAAAAAVAKAASAAAKLAAESAFHAKLMADEAVKFGRSGMVSQCSENVEPSHVNNLSNVAPASILKSNGEGNVSYSIIPAAREAARRRLEEASAANRRAQNLDAIVKAAELAAEAVSQANAIVVMGDPFPLTPSDLLQRGPDGYWKGQHSELEKLAKTMHEETQLVNKLSSGDKDLQQTVVGEIIPSSTELSTQSTENHTDGKDQLAVEDNIKEGTLVEVKSDLKGVWYSARVLDLKDSKAYICYNELFDEDGSNKIKEWITLDSECAGAPRIRNSRPTAGKKLDVTRKRRRSGSGTLVWNVGDRVDAWINEGWREGVITEKSEDDTSKFLVNFPAGGDFSVVRSWDLRPSLVWENGQWIEWHSSIKHLGDTPEKKRQKISEIEAVLTSETEAVGISKVSSNISSHDVKKSEELIPLSLSAKDRVFSMGKVTGEANNSNRIKRTGLQKEGSKVVFGIPKPGKKRKFMDVSKQCVVNNTVKREEVSKSGKLTKYQMPHSLTGWKNTAKVDTSIKQTAESKSKLFRSSKSRNVHTRNLADKGSTSISTSAASDGGNSRGTMLEKKQFLEIDSSANSKGTAEDPTSVSHLHSAALAPLRSESSGDKDAEKERQTLVLSSASCEDKGSNLAANSRLPDALEPRRSNRRIQPTSRLLEGLQSSLIIGKAPSLPHDKGSKLPHRPVPSSSRGRSRW